MSQFSAFKTVQAWTGHCAIDEHRRPLAPSKFFDVCVTEKNSIIAVAPCLCPWSWWNAV